MSPASVSVTAAAVASGRTTAEAVARDALARATAYDAVQPQAWIHRCPDDSVLSLARDVDRRVVAGERLPLAGVPFAVKDNIDVAGLPTTAGCPAFAYIPRVSAPVVERLTAAGAVLLGKTNLDQFATGLVGTRSPYGAPACVFNREYVSGGSSSGSAVLVAAGIVGFSLGTDTAGSGRVPAAFNGLVGLKPTRGRWSSRGVVPACRTLDCVTAFTTSVADAAAVDGVIAAFDGLDPYSRREPPARPALPRGFRLGVPRREQLEFFGDGESRSLYDAAIGRLVATGAEAFELDIGPLLAAAQLLYGGPWVAERAIAVDDLLRANPAAIHPVVRAIIQGGAGVSAVEAFRGLYALQAHVRTAEAMWDRLDVIALPTAPTIYRLAEVLAEPFALNSNLGRYTNFVNLLDMSAIALPAGYRANATGFGVSLIGPAFADHQLLDLALRYEAAAAPTERPALDEHARPTTVPIAVVGAHLAGMPLHWQLSSRQARLVRRARTAPVYRLYAMTKSSPPKPALVHAGPGAGTIELEIYELDVAAFGSFVAEVPPPLAIGTVLLEDGTEVHGFVAEPRALEGATDITAFGGWRAYLARREGSR